MVMIIMMIIIMILIMIIVIKKTSYKRRHDRVLQFIIFNLRVEHKIRKKCPSWYSKISVKPYYSNEDMEIFWDIPEYSGVEEEDEEKIQ